MEFKKENIRSIGELRSEKGGRDLTPVFKGEMFPVFVHVTAEEFEGVRGNDESIKDLAIQKINSPSFVPSRL